MSDEILAMAQEFDRLRGTNVCRRGTTLDLAIDESCGRLRDSDAAFREFLADVFSRLPREVAL